MDVGTYEIEAAYEESHWWFVGRRSLFLAEIGRLHLPKDARILDVGTSTGTNLRMLRDAGYTHVLGLDSSEESLRWTAAKGLPEVVKGDVCDLPFESGGFDLVLATDVLEHVEDDAQAAAEIARVLKPGGHVLITVPTFTMLWGLQDIVAHHKRRYRMPQLLRLIQRPNLVPIRSYYFNFILFIPILLARRLLKLFKVKLKSEAEVNSPFLNGLLGRIFHADITVAPYLRPPFGVSALVMAKAKQR
ncbi:class I SAM-dependent methyltransferase [Bosea sp. TND4EK4]|uniref:class I SAM-dependent methyltransferase n=1 Tax=Bosea sp. TND4EK4 TaxID=1907408 RepID=UPI000953C717|nr:class I SAM-dependent methyltransferase [Bosea sp. TND4EK4]SIR20194.1 Methyltransferase domain-containing protein [Bosea sp. TND4EK4]